MSFSYDPNKNKRNIELRDLNFDQVADLDWDNAWIYEDERNEYNEIRFIAYSTLDKRLHVVCFTETIDVSVLFHFEKQITER